MPKILIVDDKAENIYLLQSMFDTNVFSTITSKNGAEALDLMRNTIPDLIIADILMPVMDGFTFCRECKKDEILKNIPFIFYTATYTDPKDEEYALSLGADRFILKPQEPEIFIKMINDFLREVKNKRIHPKKIIQIEETIVLKEYNEVLIRKIEDKILQTEKIEKELRKYSDELEKEISEHKKHEDSLRKSEEFNRLLFNTSPIGLVLSRMDGSLVDINPEYARIIGRTIEETLKLNYWDITPEKYTTQESEQLIKLKESGHYGKYEKEFIHKDGHLVPVVLQGLILERDDERFVWSSVEDITVRKKAEIALQDSQHLFQTLAEVSPVGIFRTTPSGSTTYVNPKWSELSGLSIEKASGNRWLSAVHPEDREKLVQIWESDILFKRPSTAEYRFIQKNGKIVWVFGNAVPQWINNQINGYVGTITDISTIKQFEMELLEAKEKAEESDRLKTAFLHNISHEVRTPMNAIIGFSDLLRDPELTPEIRNEFIQTIVGSSTQLLSIITQIVSMATIEAGLEKIYEKEISLNSIFKIISDQYSSEATKKNITLEYKTGLSDDEDKIKTDETKLIQIISNLVGNSLKFTKQGSVNFGYIIKVDYIEFYIKDSGIGIPKEMHEEIFKRFSQVETSLAREYEGAGLGLSISKAYVELLGGKIWLTSEPGKGSVFYFTIPYYDVSVDKIPGNEVARNHKSGFNKPVTLLVAEDEINNFTLLTFYLSNANIVLIHATNGWEAVEICKNNSHINLVLMDLKMPVMDGFEATKRIKEFRPELPIIAQTAYNRDVDKAKAFACGCSDFISKPFKKEELLNLIKGYLVLD